VQQSTRGADLAPKAIRDAGLALGAAEDGLKLLHEQIVEANAAYDLAKAAHDAAVQAGKLQAVADAKRAVITAGDIHARNGVALAESGTALTHRYSDLFAALRDAGQIPASHEMDALAGLKRRIIGPVPLEYQNQIIAGGAARTMDVSQFERTTWLRGAAPDEAADAPHIERERIQAERIRQQQEIEAAGLAHAAKAGGSIPSWMPTDMGPRGRSRVHWNQ
jgi:hypothetical protein